MTLNNLLKFSLKNKIILSFFSFVLVVFSLVYFIIVPTIKDIRNIDKEIEGRRIKIEERYRRSLNLKQSMNNLKKIEPRLILLDQIFINKSRELEFITAIENEANDNQITQKINLKPPQAEENTKFQKSSLELNSKGKFDKQLKYLSALESLSYYINIKLLELTPTDSRKKTKISDQESPSQNDQTINMLINANTYWE